MAERVGQGKFRIPLLVGDSEQAGELVLEVAERPQAGLRGIDVIQRPVQQIVKRGVRVFRFHCGFEELAAIGGKQDGGVVFPQPLAPAADRNLAQGVQLTSPRTLKCDLTREKQIKSPGKRTDRPSRTFGHGLDQTVRAGEPMHNPARIRQPGEADEGRLGGLHAAAIGFLT